MDALRVFAINLMIVAAIAALLVLLPARDHFAVWACSAAYMVLVVVRLAWMRVFTAIEQRRVS